MVKTEFSIKDLENLSDVKAHTIRIWEKRYNLLEPDRTDTNIRRYDMDNLKKLLNITLLYKAGHKISKLAEMDPIQIQTLITEETESNSTNYALESLRAAMLAFNVEKFDSVLENLLNERDFRDIYLNILVPLLRNAGMLWQTGTVDPSHEHFISQRIKHLLILKTAEVKKNIRDNELAEFVLYLPSGEGHEIGLLYANYELVRRGFKTLYLGANIPTESLEPVLKQKRDAIFVSYFTVCPKLEDMETYIQNFLHSVGAKNEFWILGNRPYKNKGGIKSLKRFEEITSFVGYLDKIS
ncbi:MerR family transcriptional regulator [Aequorivita ciconiae]|uniref:MerR family transcriptional regulator n=1 Tax=Aequorivita ciconiae TaxID=2494375 RepID=UPI001F0C5FF1|nr:MerR family transcriptional regulator [Aequorivita sp. H23M31]